MLVLALLTCVLPATSHAQSGAPDGWAFGAGGYVTDWPDETFSAFSSLAGPAAQASLLRPNGFGVDFRLGYIVPTGFYDMTGLSADAGASYGWPVGGHLVQARLGLTGFLGGDNDGGVAQGFGPYGGGAMTFRLTGRLGLQLEALGRVYVSSGEWFFAPGFAASVMLLPK